MSGAGGSGVGRPANDQLADEAYQVWRFVQDRTAEVGKQEAAIAEAMVHFKLKRATVFRRLELIENVIGVLAAMKEAAPEQFEQALERLNRRGWFDDPPSYRAN